MAKNGRGQRNLQGVSGGHRSKKDYFRFRMIVEIICYKKKKKVRKKTKPKK
jgi:hypothetical protein